MHVEDERPGATDSDVFEAAADGDTTRRATPGGCLRRRARRKSGRRAAFLTRAIGWVCVRLVWFGLRREAHKPSRMELRKGQAAQGARSWAGNQ